MRVQLDEFNSMQATHVVGLGSSCCVAYNLRRYFNFGGAFPFDWWVSNGDGLARFLAAPDAEKLYEPSNLELTPNAASVRNKDFGFLFHHEFNRHWKVPGSPVQEDWQESTELPKQRTLALWEKLVRLDDEKNRICFFRNEKLSPELVDALERLFPRAEWTIVELKSSAEAANWKGDPNVWDKELASTGVTLDLTFHKPFAEYDNSPEHNSRVIHEK